MATLLAQEEEEANEIIPTCRKVKRLAVIDGCNVIHACAGMSTHAYHEFGERKPKPDAIGLLIVLKRLLDEDFEVRMFISSRFMSVKETNNFFILEALVKFNYLAVVPTYLYDDIPILYWASKCAGFVISNDKYREFKSIPLCCEATTRVIKFAFKPMDLQEIGGKKALGEQEHKFRFGMDLCLDLDRRICMSDIREDTNFLNVYSTRRRHNITKAARARQPCLCLMEVLSVMADFLQQQFCFVHGMEPPHLDYIGESANPSTQFETFIGLYLRRKRQLFDLTTAK